MPQYFLDYVDSLGDRVTNISGHGFANLREAETEAAKIIREFIGGGRHSDMLGHIEIVDEAGAWVSEFHFPAEIFWQ